MSRLNYFLKFENLSISTIAAFPRIMTSVSPLAKFVDFFNFDTKAIYQNKMMKFSVEEEEKTIIDIARDIILSKYPSGGVISFDACSKTCILMIIHIIFISAKNVGFNIDEIDIESYPRRFGIGTIEKNIWEWIAVMVDSCKGWEEVENFEISQHMDKFCNMYETEYKVEKSTIFLVQNIIVMIFNLIGDVIYNFYPITEDCGKNGVTITGVAKNTGFPLMGIIVTLTCDKVNRTVFRDIQCAAVSFPVEMKLAIQKNKLERKSVKSTTKLLN